jgi:hypothetical protein
MAVRDYYHQKKSLATNQTNEREFGFFAIRVCSGSFEAGLGDVSGCRDPALRFGISEKLQCDSKIHPFFSFSTVIGNLRTLLLVAAKMAFAIAGATGGTAVSPKPPGMSDPCRI